jgi:hypothetical protein
VGDEQNGLALGGPDAEELAAHDVASDEVERTERLVEEQHVRLDRQGARHLDPLLHAAGNLVWVGVLEPLEPDQLHVVLDAARPLGVRQIEQAEPDVPLHGQPGEHAVLLEDDHPPPIRPDDRLAVDAHLPGGRLVEAGHDVEQRGLAAPGGADHHHQLAFVDLEIDALEDVDLLAVAPEHLLHAACHQLDGTLCDAGARARVGGRDDRARFLHGDPPSGASVRRL